MKKIWGLYHISRKFHNAAFFHFKTSHFTDKTGSNSLKLFRNANLKKQLLIDINDLRNVIENEQSFQKDIKFNQFSLKIIQNFSLVMENWKDLGFFLDTVQFLDYLEILKKIKIRENKLPKMDNFLWYFLESFKFYLENDKISTFAELFHFLELYPILFHNVYIKNDNFGKMNEVLSKIKGFFKKDNLSKSKITIAELKIFSNFLKELKPMKNADLPILLQEIFAENKLDLTNAKNYDYSQL